MTSQVASVKLSPDVRSALIDLLYRLADDSLIIGHRNSEWTGLGPILEEDIAFSSMSQDKIGHAVAFFTLLHELGEPAPDSLAYARTAPQFRCCSLVSLGNAGDSDAEVPDLCNNPLRNRLVAHGDWARSAARQFFFSEADAVRLAALEKSAYVPLAQLARKLRGEIKYHTMHGRMLIEKLAVGEDGRVRMQAAVDQLYGHALGMFEPTGSDQALESAGICPPEKTLCGRWRQTVDPLLEAAGLSVPDDADPVYGGRIGKHPADLAEAVDDLQKVYRLDPTASW